MKRKIMALCLVVVLMLGVSGCGAKSECKELIGNLETACNSMDVDGILDCFNPDTVAPIKMVLNTFGEGKENLINFVYDMLGISVQEGESAEETLETIKLEPTEFELSDESGTVNCTLSIEVGDSIVEKELVFEVIKVDEQWYIEGLK